MQIITFGCRLNIFESAAIEKLVGADLPNVILFNTCAVTAEAERQLRQAIRKAKRENPNTRIYVAGCAAQLHPENYALMPEVDRVLGNREKLSKAALLAKEKTLVASMDIPQEGIDTDVPIISDFAGKTKAFLQIQQGCNHACTFCVVHHIRGKNTGLHPDTVIRQAKTFVGNGYPELILTGVDLAAYPYGFCGLIRRLLTEVDGLKRLRFGSLDPAVLSEEFVALMASDKRLMPHIHLSIQAGDDLILKRMGRRHTKQDILTLADKLRQVRPDIVLGADFIAGFPTETDAQFNETMDLVKRANITHLHVFPYSERDGTPAAKMPQLPVSIRKERAKKLRDLGTQQMEHLLDKMVGKTISVLVEQPFEGTSENYLKVRFETPQIVGQIVDVRITKRENNELVG
ncbi:MAG: tRNA (N(6)-L-threonylcarbamoyladenosine(37)-C(2))-methylthiotransferase MtaB [Alphaproteobacteria bacterium]|nr:tRNA (N(6)-L-threonylcarbamoyladenosine(37)-C(2))-methylthiotransferase MtaB [Alphaproteobacteria bacterium]